MGFFKAHYVVLAFCVLLSACSMPRLGYQNLDRLVRWKIDDYVSLNRDQKRWFAAEVQAQHAWHCHKDLPRYRPLLVALRDELLSERPDPNRVHAQLPLWKSEVDRTLERLAPSAAEFLGQLEALQVSSLFSKLDERQQELHEEYVAPDAQSQITERSERMQKRLKHWLGQLNSEQIILVDQWADQPAGRNALWVANRQHWQQALQDKIDQHDAAELPSQLTTLFTEPQRFWLEPYREQRPAAERQMIQMVTDVMVAADAKQKSRMQRRIDGLLGDLDSVRCPALPDLPEPSAVLDIATNGV